MSKTQWERTYRKAYQRVSRLCEGGRQYGIDRPTLHMKYPTWLRTLDIISARIAEGHRA
jgi:hypothetical protein